MMAELPDNKLSWRLLFSSMLTTVNLCDHSLTHVTPEHLKDDQLMQSTIQSTVISRDCGVKASAFSSPPC